MTAPAKAAPMREDVTQADREAAASLIESYWPNDDNMQAMAARYRAGHSQGVWAHAFARHRIAHPAAPQGEDTVTLKMMTDKEAWAWADEHSADDPASFCATLDTLNKLGLIKPALAPAAIASGRGEGE